jgi:hypothetical protein
MQAYLPEKIGNPDLFSGRKKELELFQNWIAGIKKGISRSYAILSRRKTGKTALMQRLYNLTFEKNDGVVPFYYEIKEGKVWAVDFCRDFYFTFIWQYIAFKSRKAEYTSLSKEEKYHIPHLVETIKKERLDYLLGSIHGIERLLAEGRADLLLSLIHI